MNGPKLAHPEVEKNHRLNQCEIASACMRCISTDPTIFSAPTDESDSLHRIS